MSKSVIAMLIGMCVTAAVAEPLKIIGFETGNGITFEGATVSNYYTLEFAAAAGGPWTNWGSITEQPITGTVMAIPSPFFYRIRQTDSSAFPPYALVGHTHSNITSSMLAPSAVETPNIADGAITEAKIAAGAVGTTQLASGLTLGGITLGTFSGPLTGNVTGNVSGSAASFTGSLVGDVTGTQGATAIAASTVTGKALAGFSSGAGAISTSDTLLTAINKLDGNVALKAPLASPTFTGNVGIGATSATSKLAVAGVIESTTGGVKFPDGTTQTTAATGIGAAQFVRTVQSPNNSVPPGTAFTIDTEVCNTIPAAIVASAGSGGTVFTLTAGLYVLDYEMSLDSAGSVGLYEGPTAGALALDLNTIAGASTATTWIHGRALVQVQSTRVVAVSPVVGTASVVTAGSAAGSYLIRLTVLKIQ